MILLFKYGEWMLRIIVAAICGFIIGYERESRNKEAGIRTHAIVALGAALIMVVSKYGFADVLQLKNYVLDPSRISAQIVSGIGFLGAGIIFKENRSVSGLTTAAGLWATAGVGMAIGSGLYYIGVPATVLILCIQFLLHKQVVLKKEHKYHKVIIVINDKTVLRSVQEQLQQKHVEVENVEVTRTEEMHYRVELLMLYPNGCDSLEVSRLILECDGVRYLKG